MPLFGAPEPITIPGAVDAFCRLSEDHGKLGLDAVLAPVIHYAEAGVPVAPRAAFDWMNHHGNLSGRARDYYLVGGEAPCPGQLFRQPRQAEVLRRIAAEGRAGFYEGEVAEDMVASLRAIGGVHTLEDFAATRSDYTTPVSGHYKGVELVEHPPNGQGATAILLNHILAEFDIAVDGPVGHAARPYRGGGDEARLCHAGPDHRRPRPRHGLAGDAGPRNGQGACRADRPGRAMPCPPHPTESRHKETVYLTVVDRDRMAVSIIYSIFKDFGSGVASDKFGILFHNRGAGFRLDEGHPNEAMGGKRPMHTIIPAMLKENGKVTMPFGVMGGQYQSTGHARMVTNIVDFGLNPQAAIDAPRCFTEYGPMKVEKGYCTRRASGACRSGPQRRRARDRHRWRAGDPHPRTRRAGRWVGPAQGRLRPRLLRARSVDRGSVELVFQRVTAFGELAEQVAQIRMIHRLTGVVWDQVLLGNIGHVVGVVVLGQQVVERLTLAGTRALGDRVIPFVGVGKLRVDIEHHTAKRVFLVPHHLTQIVFRLSLQHFNKPLSLC
jgi:gamma-glutamyltranspeptidase/glutathione hydrolase